MRLPIILMAGTGLLFTAAPAFAQDTAPPSPITVSGSLSVLTDYRLRGVSQTDKDAAVQGSLTVAHQSGFYVGAFASNLSGWGTFGGANIELDGIVGYKHDFGGTTVDGGVTWYTYPGGASESDVVELYAKASAIYGPVTLTSGVAYAPNQTSLGRFYYNADQYAAGTPVNPKRWDNLYLSVDASSGIPTTPVTVRAHLGHSSGNPGLGPNGTSLSPTGSYFDWSAGADVVVYKNLSLNLSYIDTNISRRGSAYLAPNFRETSDLDPISDATFVAGITASF